MGLPLAESLLGRRANRVCITVAQGTYPQKGVPPRPRQLPVLLPPGHPMLIGRALGSLSPWIEECPSAQKADLSLRVKLQIPVVIYYLVQ